ncbi:restriction endonuclease subunit S [Acetobacter oryzifermentans]|uniref:restriction endonuclease subunit S n=1 Tax=Acetobacter oryzifermentans TaxID=1633874 RepID=UPI003463FE4B
MSEHWRSSTWGEEISLEYGKSNRTYNTEKGRFRVYGSNGPIGWTDTALVNEPGVVLGRKGAYRGVQFSKTPFFVIDTAYYVKPKNSNDIKWLYYAIISDKLGEIDDGSPIPSTTRSAVYVREIDVPPIKEQKAIASILGSLDDKIDLNRRTNETLEVMARALFRDWFVDFGPTRAKMAGEAPYLAPELWELFPDRLDDEGKPEGWHISSIGDEADIVGGSTPSTSNPIFWNGNHFWATPKDLSGLNSPVLSDTSRQITDEGLTQISSGLLPSGSVLLSSRAPVGYTAITTIPLAINQGFIGVKCAKSLSAPYVLLWMKESMELILQNANGSTFQEISKKNFRPLPIIKASHDLLKAFDIQSQGIFDKIIVNEAESRNLAQLRDLLLPKLMSGEISIRDAEKMVEDAA